MRSYPRFSQISFALLSLALVVGPGLNAAVATPLPSGQPKTEKIDCGLLMGDGMITPELIAKMQLAKQSESADRQALLKLARRTTITAGFINESLLSAHENYFSHDLGCDSVVDQKNTGTCWYQATNNLFRVDGFDSSVSYAFFYHLLNQSNQHLSNVISKHLTALTPENRWALMPRIEQGGFFQTATKLIDDYGLVPRAAMPYTEAMNNPVAMIKDLKRNISATTLTLVKAMARKASAEELAEIRLGGLTLAWNTLSAYLGNPPSYLEIPRAKWPASYVPARLKEGNAELALLTPQEFARDILKFSSDNYVTIGSYPMLKINQNYVSERGGPANDGPAYADVKFLNLSSERMMELAQASLSKNIAVPFGADISVDTDQNSGIMHPEIFQHSVLYGITPAERASQLNRTETNYFGLSVSNHEMLLVGYNLPSNQTMPDKFKVENSWGANVGNRGMFTLYREWWPNVYEISIRADFLNDTEKALLKSPPVKVKHNY